MMTNTYDALVAHGTNDLRIDHLPLPQPKSDEAVIDVRFGGICGSDLHYWKHRRVGDSVLKEPMILGHEVVGIVRTQASDGSGPRSGTPVALHPATVCGRCEYCLGGRQNLCTELRYMGSAARLPHTPGGFAERLLVATQRLVEIPSNLDMRVAALAEPAAIAWQAIGRVASLGRHVGSQRVLVIGAGPIGLLAIAVLRRARAREIIASDVYDRPLRVTELVGATSIVKAGNAREELATKKPEIVIECSGSPHGIAAALTIAKPGGLIVSVGQLPRDGLHAPLHLAVTRELTLTGSSRLYGELPAVLEALADGSLDVAPIISDIYPLEDAEEAFTKAADASESSKVLIDFANSGSRQ